MHILPLKKNILREENRKLREKGRKTRLLIQRLIIQTL